MASLQGSMATGESCNAAWRRGKGLVFQNVPLRLTPFSVCDRSFPSFPFLVITYSCGAPLAHGNGGNGNGLGTSRSSTLSTPRRRSTAARRRPRTSTKSSLRSAAALSLLPYEYPSLLLLLLLLLARRAWRPTNDLSTARYGGFPYWLPPPAARRGRRFLAVRWALHS